MPCFRKTITAIEIDRAEKVPVATHIVKTEVAVQGPDHYVPLSDVKTMIDKPF